MRNRLSVIIILFVAFGCKKPNSKVVVQVINLTSNPKFFKLKIDDINFECNNLEIANTSKDFKILGNYSFSNGIHKLRLENNNRILSDSFKLNENAYFTIIFRNDLDKYNQRDSFVISLMSEKEFKKTKFY